MLGDCFTYDIKKETLFFSKEFLILLWKFTYIFILSLYIWTVKQIK